ncbi:hypothetical protein Cylst_2518 [Cylindrospermum stagnale PCC 7417]|uniref:Uncharacterized protein n=1 Tax=Cylindrospermum stagnale PCC 7417 TaxID=56107 RepID=K9WYZ0_9NOST|nr:hypothetical protein [Cylindrospermum stagnale]AFZ24727.1 hypothetical protein Cylst_2518 [Cylindrospermum stagnale PCC 7417]
MYNRQHRTSRKSNSQNTPAPNRFAPRGFGVLPKTEEVTPQQDQTPEEQTQKEEAQQYQSGFLDGLKLTPRPSPARTPRIQMKLTLGQPGDMYQQETVPSNPIAIQPQANTDLSPEQNPTLEPFEKVEEVATEAVEIQRLSELGDNGDDDANSPNGGTVQRACSECETEKSLLSSRLTIGSTGDKYEQETDSMAERVMSMDTPTTKEQIIQRQGEEQEQPQQRQPLSASITPLVQRLSELVQRMAEVKASTKETLVNSNKEPLFTSKQDHLESTQLPLLQPKHINQVNALPGNKAKYLDNHSHKETSTAQEQPIQRLTDKTLQRSGNSDTTSATPSLENRLGSQTGGGIPEIQGKDPLEPKILPGETLEIALNKNLFKPHHQKSAAFITPLIQRSPEEEAETASGKNTTEGSSSVANSLVNTDKVTPNGFTPAETNSNTSGVPSEGNSDPNNISTSQSKSGDSTKSNSLQPPSENGMGQEIAVPIQNASQAQVVTNSAVQQSTTVQSGVSTNQSSGVASSTSIAGTATNTNAPQVATASAPEFSTDAGGLSPEYASLIQELATQHAILLTNAEQQKAQITSAAEQQKQSIQQMVETEALRVEGTYDQVITGIQSTGEAQRQSIYTGLEAERAKVNAAADAEISQLETAVTTKKTAILNKGQEKAQKADMLGNQEAQRAQQGSTERGKRAQQIGNEKSAQYSGGDKGKEIAGNINNEVPKLVSKFLEMGNNIASSVREKATGMAGHFRGEAGEIAGEFDKQQGNAKQKILDNRDKTLQSLQTMADDAATQLGKDTNDLVTKLSSDKAGKAAQVRELAPGLSNPLDGSVKDALAKIDAQTTSTSDELNNFAEKVKEGGWYAPFVQDARAEMLAAQTAQQNEQQNFVTQVISSFSQAASTAQGEATGQAQTLISAVEKVGNDFQTNASKVADETKGKMQEASSKGEESMKAVTTAVESKLQEAVDKSDSEWEKQLSEKGKEITELVDNALTKQDSVLSNFSSDIDSRAARAANPGIFESIWNFVAGVFEGLVLGAWEMLKSVWEAMKTPLFWIVVAVVAVVLVIAVVALVIGGATVMAAIGAVLAFVGKVLLVIGIIAGVIAAGYFLYQMLTKPNLSWRERGQLFGKAIFELIMAFAGTGILKRLGVFGQLGRLSEFVKRVGGVGRAIRLINKLPNLEKLIQLLDKVGDAEKLIQLLDKVNDAEKVIELIDTVGNVETVLNLVKTINKADDVLKLWRAIGNADEILKLWNEIKNADNIIKLWSEIKNADDILKLWNEFKNADEILAIWKAVGNTEDIARLLKLKDMTPALLVEILKAKNMTVASLEALMTMPEMTAPRLKSLLDEVGDAELLIRLFTALEDSNPAHLPVLLQEIKKFGLSPNDLLNILEEAKQARNTGIPIGIPEKLFVQASQTAREMAAGLGYGSDIVVQGSRVRGYSMDFVNGVLEPVLKRVQPGPDTDLDVAVRLSQEAFNAALKKSFGTPNPGSAKAKTMGVAIEDGRIFGGDARPNLREIRKTIARILQMPEDKVQVTLVNTGGKFDSTPTIPLK